MLASFDAGNCRRAFTHSFHRPRAIRLYALAILSPFLFGFGEASVAEEAVPKAKPNIIFILTDDLSWNLVQYMPHVLQMEKDGVTFANAFVTDSLCCPSRASIFTGRYPHDTGIFRHAGRDGGYAGFKRRGLEQASFAAALSAAGYRTAM